MVDFWLCLHIMRNKGRAAMNKDNIAVMMFLRNIFFCGVLFSFLFYPYIAFAAEDTRPDFSVACPSSEERAKVWGVPLLKPELLVGPLAFLNVPYPKRDYELAANELKKIISTGDTLAKIPAEWGAKETNPNNIDYPPTDRFMLIYLLLGTDFSTNIKHQVSYLFVVDEGCGNLTVWRVGFIVKPNTTLIKRIVVRRTFDDADFTKRGIPFVFRDFDQMIVPRGIPSNDRPMARALWALSNGSLSKLESIFSEVSIIKDAPNPQHYPNTFSFNYKPNYRPKLGNNWSIWVDFNGDNLVSIKTLAPSATYP